MSEYVWCTADVHLADGRFTARLLPGQVWWADHPLVQAHPDLFSATPLRVEPEHYRPQPGITRPNAVRASMPVVDDAERAVAAINAAPGREPGRLAETDPTVDAVVTADLARRRTRRG